MLGNRDDAVEVTQEALLRTFWKITGFHGRAHFYTWLYRIVLNLCYRRLDARRREPNVLPARPLRAGDEDTLPSPEERLVDPAPSPSEAAQQREHAALVREALGALKPEDFQLLVLREFEALSYEEIATRLRIPQGTVMSRLHRARLALAEQLTRLGVAQ